VHAWNIQPSLASKQSKGCVFWLGFCVRPLVGLKLEKASWTWSRLPRDGQIKVLPWAVKVKEALNMS
jgi:hypothetical protein